VTEIAGARVLVDEELAGEMNLMCGAGDEGWVFVVSGEVLQNVIGAVVAQVHA
jgi:prolyl-tRNA editing enzyme YbaK/EbsC (Cys-tRNA(Pro) deacylase)